MMPRPGAANGVVPKNGIGIAFCNAGVPGNADMVKVMVPSASAAGTSRRGISAALNKLCAMGTRTKKATNRLTPPYVTMAPASVTARTAREVPSLAVMKLAMTSTEPLSSMSFPNTAPRRNKGKNWARNFAAPPMKVSVQWASNGSFAAAAAMRAAAGANSSTLQPRKDSQIRSPRPRRMPARPTSIRLDRTFAYPQASLTSPPNPSR